MRSRKLKAAGNLDPCRYKVSIEAGAPLEIYSTTNKRHRSSLNFFQANFQGSETLADPTPTRMPAYIQDMS